MRHLQSFSIFESSDGLTPEQKEFLDECVRGSWTLNLEGKIDIRGDFLGFREDLINFKGIEFGEVVGDFNCKENRLTSLQGCPIKVGGNFRCYSNRITSLESGPEEVSGYYDCSPNDFMTSLVGAPKILENYFEGPREIFVWSGEWNPEGIFKSWKELKNPQGKKLLETIFPTHIGRDFFQKMIDEDPSKALSELKPLFSVSVFRSFNLQWPAKMQVWVDLMGDAGELGF
jgi:hypothetical protein